MGYSTTDISNVTVKFYDDNGTEVGETTWLNSGRDYTFEGTPGGTNSQLTIDISATFIGMKNIEVVYELAVFDSNYLNRLAPGTTSAEPALTMKTSLPFRKVVNIASNPVIENIYYSENRTNKLKPTTTYKIEVDNKGSPVLNVNVLALPSAYSLGWTGPSLHNLTRDSTNGTVETWTVVIEYLVNTDAAGDRAELVFVNNAVGGDVKGSLANVQIFRDAASA